jgi:NADH:ubiquinone oxidoreductase subunit 3 (subunit A)
MEEISLTQVSSLSYIPNIFVFEVLKALLEINSHKNLLFRIIVVRASISIVLVRLYFLTNYSTYTDSGEKLTSFECGFDPLSKRRSPFSTRFFLLVVIFLIFDVEIALLFPCLRLFSTSYNPIRLTSVIVFLSILVLGIIHE